MGRETNLFAFLKSLKVVVVSTIVFEIVSLSVVLTLLLSCGKEQGSEKTEEQRKFELGIKYIEDGEGEKALKVFDELLRIDSKNPQYIWGKALAIVEKELALASEKTKRIVELVANFGKQFSSKFSEKTQDERGVFDALLKTIFEVGFLKTTDKFSRFIRQSKFFELAEDDFVLPIKRFRINFYLGGKEVSSITFWGKHGIEEAYLISGLAELIRIILYSILSVSFDMDFDEVFKILEWTRNYGGIVSIFAYPITVGFPAFYWLVERNKRFLTAPYEREKEKVRLAMRYGVDYFENYHFKIYGKFRSGNLREGFLIFAREDDRVYLRAQLGEDEIREFSTGTVEGIGYVAEGMKLLRNSIERGELVPCSRIAGPITALLSALANSGFYSAWQRAVRAGAGETGLEIGETFRKILNVLTYFVAWFSAFVQLCERDLFYFDFTKYFDALENIRNILPAYFSVTTKPVISPLRNMIIEWECGDKENMMTTLNYNTELIDPTSGGFMCKRRIKLFDSEHFADFVTMVKFAGNLTPDFAVIQPDGIYSPTPYIFVPDPTLAGFLYVDPKVLWEDCDIPCGGKCEIQKLEGIEGQCILNAGFAEIGRRIYTGRGF